jgi:primosomal protein N' (replication factor Y) (superfamily II helicase)
LYASLIKQDYEQFAQHLLAERQQAGVPPFMYQALLRAEANELQLALAFLETASTLCEHPGIVIHAPIPLAITRVANRERAQLLIESTSRPGLQGFLKQWMGALRGIKSRVKWGLEVDPMDI